ncbi:MAG TPA: hypothetical protein VI756_19680 [Blastocatellia bacterium]
MKCKHWTLLACIAILAGSIQVSAQSGTQYDDPVSKYKILMIGDWRAVSYNDAVGRQKTDFVYRDRSEGLLKISHENMGTKSLSDVVQDEEQSVQMAHAGFEMNGTEDFAAGSLHGVRLSYFYTEGSRKFTVTNYLLKDGDQLWQLRFTGKRGVVDEIRNVTDEMARSFRTYQ